MFATSIPLNLPVLAVTILYWGRGACWRPAKPQDIIEHKKADRWDSVTSLNYYQVPILYQALCAFQKIMLFPIINVNLLAYVKKIPRN